MVDDNNIYSKSKYLDVNLKKCVQDLYAESYKTPMKKIKEHLNKWRDLYSWLRRFDIVKMSVLPKLMYSDNRTFKIFVRFLYRVVF